MFPALVKLNVINRLKTFELTHSIHFVINIIKLINSKLTIKCHNLSAILNLLMHFWNGRVTIVNCVYNFRASKIIYTFGIRRMQDINILLGSLEVSTLLTNTNFITTYWITRNINNIIHEIYKAKATTWSFQIKSVYINVNITLRHQIKHFHISFAIKTINFNRLILMDNKAIVKHLSQIIQRSISNRHVESPVSLL